MRFNVEVRGYEEGEGPLTAQRIESMIAALLDTDYSSGVVIVSEGDVIALPDDLRKEVADSLASESDAWFKQALEKVAAHFGIPGGAA